MLVNKTSNACSKIIELLKQLKKTNLNIYKLVIPFFFKKKVVAQKLNPKKIRIIPI